MYCMHIVMVMSYALRYFLRMVHIPGYLNKPHIWSKNLFFGKVLCSHVSMMVKKICTPKTVPLPYVRGEK